MVPTTTGRRRCAGEDGTSAVEYGLLVAAIAAVIVGVVFAVGTQMRHTFDGACQAIATGGAAPHGDQPDRAPALLRPSATDPCAP